jgi:geranylgeranyl diphosphate synthase, type II
MIAFDDQFECYVSEIEAALPAYLPVQPVDEGGLPLEAGRYSLLGGGKRIRPVLLLAVCDLLGSEHQFALPFACALEMIHTYSLIHDDLPAMDNDDQRRGRPTCHVVYGEAIAILAGDVLLNRAYEVMLDAVAASGCTERAVQAARLIAAAAGGRGMIGGQALDLAAEGKVTGADHLKRIHNLKTGALLKAPIMAAASLAAASRDKADLLAAYADAIGLAFQIQDDILDVTADSATLGKSAGKDQRDTKSTYISLFGLDEARQQLAENVGLARAQLVRLAHLGLSVGFFTGLTDFLLTRTN